MLRDLAEVGARLSRREAEPASGAAVFMVEVSPPLASHHGTDHDLNCCHRFRGCLPTRPLHCRQEEHRSGRTTAQGLGRSLGALIVSEVRTPLLKKSRWLLLKREENLKAEQRFRLRDLLRYNVKTVRVYLLKEAFQQLWDYNSPAWAGKFLDEWCRRTMRPASRPMKKIACSLQRHPIRNPPPANTPSIKWSNRGRLLAAETL